MNTREMGERVAHVVGLLEEASIHASYLTVHESGQVNIHVQHAVFDAARGLFGLATTRLILNDDGAPWLITADDLDTSLVANVKHVPASELTS